MANATCALCPPPPPPSPRHARLLMAGLFPGFGRGRRLLGSSSSLLLGDFFKILRGAGVLKGETPPCGLAARPAGSRRCAPAEPGATAPPPRPRRFSPPLFFIRLWAVNKKHQNEADFKKQKNVLNCPEDRLLRKTFTAQAVCNKLKLFVTSGMGCIFNQRKTKSGLGGSCISRTRTRTRTRELRCTADCSIVPTGPSLYQQRLYCISKCSMEGAAETRSIRSSGGI
jgi:hypothetical protein